MPEKRILLKNCEVVDPGDISTYLDQDGFKALEKALSICNCALILVSHDLRFLTSLVTTMWRLTPATADNALDTVELEMLPIESIR